MKLSGLSIIWQYKKKTLGYLVLVAVLILETVSIPSLKTVQAALACSILKWYKPSDTNANAGIVAVFSGSFLVLRTGVINHQIT